MGVDIRARAYHDRVAKSRKRRAWLIGIGVGVGIVLVMGSAVWVFFFSPVFAVSGITVTGADTIGNTTVAQSVQALLDQKRLYIFQPHRNILLLHTDAVSQYLQDQYAAIAQTVVTKQYPHTIQIQVTERQSIGTWCRESDCQFFDATGALWGRALPSVGPLLLLVNDDRANDGSMGVMVPAILTAVADLSQFGLAAKSITLPDAEPGAITITTTKGYDIYLDGLGNIADQFQVLGIFLANQATNTAFAPKYIDIRTPGRVYYQ